jgi:hypothetical protein
VDPPANIPQSGSAAFFIFPGKVSVMHTLRLMLLLLACGQVANAYPKGNDPELRRFVHISRHLPVDEGHLQIER